VIALTEDQCVPVPEWCARIRAAHEGPYAAVGGPVDKLLPRDDGSDRALNWAQYLCDFSRYMSPVPSGASDYLTDTNVAYKREALAPIRALWQDEFHETTVNWALAGAGRELYLSQDITVFQHRELSWGPALAERFAFGRLFASTRAREAGSRRWLFALGSAALPAVLTLRVIQNVVGRGRHFGGLAKALPAVVILASTWALGELVGYVTGSAGGELKPQATQ
jgi:hypothetical protein